MSAASCQILFKYSRFSWSIFEVRIWDLTLLIIFFTWKTTTNLKSCIELNKVIYTKNFCGKETSWYLRIFIKKREFKSSQNANEVIATEFNFTIFKTYTLNKKIYSLHLFEVSQNTSGITPLKTLSKTMQNFSWNMQGTILKINIYLLYRCNSQNLT